MATSMNKNEKTILTCKNGLVVVAYKLEDIEDPNIFGETIRALVYKEDRSGYYSFEVEQEFKDITETKFGQLFIKKFLTDIEEEMDKAKVYYNGEIYSGIYWDGDGIMAVSYNGMTALNTDCKKDYNWEWVSKKVSK